METEALRWFQQVGDGMTVTEVGEMFQVTQSGVSRGLARLEQEMGTPLLRRNGRLLRMTHAGTVFKRHVDALLHELDDGVAAVEQLIDPERGTVALSFQVSLGTWLVPRLLDGYRALRPEVRFALQQSRDELSSPVLGDSRIDLEITAVRPSDRSVRWHRLFIEPLCLAVPPDHPLAEGTAVDLADAAQDSFIVLRPTSQLRQRGAELCARAGFEAQITLEADDLPTVRAFVAAGLGVAIVPAARAGTADAARQVLRHLPINDPLATREIGIAQPAGRRLLPAAEGFLAYALDSAQSGRLPQVANSAAAPGHDDVSSGDQGMHHSG